MSSTDNAGSSDEELTRSRIEAWDTTHLDDAAARWRQMAAQSEELFEWHRQNVAAPGGTEWSGDAGESALNRVTTDAAVVRKQGDIQREAANIAEDGSRDLRLAVGQVLDAIAAAEADGFEVGEDLSVRDTRRIDVSTMAKRYTASREHAEDIRWHAERLVQTDIYLGQRLQGKALELDGMQFEA
ncbi:MULTISPECIES: hypothetical protein [Mycolicibacterium]|uniref:ESX-1 secretion-associated protein EspA/EspE-like domain-containing protein n=1 Tax=Mycolicibacterium wolinskyi TaxID=59750 RepID=A0A132PSU5_9MYCO|nr:MULTISPECIES: hypothetical protein [Mycolicibacterium]KWX25421.1 hypothetical protein AFM11_03935 [Mycolicibacterium wolinskyi]MCV7284461.1 hypothetical protein [Mycolicibacterium wolinskyi]MCV7291850.1 hypothetical protein [Mycolicibacterium goodii]ORX16556.1 hypothetical protein AWC31_21230 [Mycolicibacterium wolinskyi]